MDGLRGWAALSVVIFHFSWELWGHSRPEFRSVPVGIIASGRLAVAIFFSLSGYVLTIRRWRSEHNPPFYVAAFRRYVRLTIPIFVASMLYYLAMVLHLTPVYAASLLIDYPVATGVLANFQPRFWEAMLFSLFVAYFPQLRHAYHPFLWTMFFELWGSFLLFFISQSNRVFRDPYSPLLLLIVFWLWAMPLGACFFIGALVALLQKDGYIFRAPPSATESRIATVVFIVGVIAAGWMHVPTETLTFQTFNGLMPSALTGVVVTFASIRSVPVATFLMRPLSQVLANLSFPLYLAHGVIAVAFMPWVVLWAGSFGPISDLTAALIAASCVLASLLLGQVLLPVERFTLSLVKRMTFIPSQRRAKAPPQAAAAE